ncbi:MAG TPA: rhodanese-like domain-containing protein [Steroidobacteraceae bacterium]|nr:rhodanese-like domain-containing protein [Steroidobacteraceae bacterium]
MQRIIEYTTNHPALVAATVIVAIVTVVIELRQRARGSAMVSPNDVVQLTNRGGALLLDIRDQAQFESGHIIDSRHVPSGELATRAETLKKYKEKPVVVYCDNGFASAAAARMLRGLGFTKVATLRGGLQSWKQDNLPLVKGPLAKSGKDGK